MSEITVRHNALTAQEFIDLWNTTDWRAAPGLEQAKLGMEHTLYRVSVYDGDKVIAMARLIGDIGLCVYVKDVIVRTEYRGQGYGRMVIEDILNYVRSSGLPGTQVCVELSALPKNHGFYEKLGFTVTTESRLVCLTNI